MIDFLLGVPGKLKAIADYLTTNLSSDRAAKIDKIDTLETRLTATRAGYLDGSIVGQGKMRGQTILSGSGNWTVPAGVSAVSVILVGGGGGGGRAAAPSGGGGGGGGAILHIPMYPVTPGGSIAYSVGGGGAGRTGSAGAGADGGNTTFGPFTAFGGSGGGKTSSGEGGGGGGGQGGFSTTTQRPGGGIADATTDMLKAGSPFVFGFGGGAGEKGSIYNSRRGGASLGLGGSSISSGYGSGGGGASYGPGADGNVTAQANSGGGGGGGYNNGDGRSGGSGRIMIGWVA